jgi:Xaa-Pro aminopeptidase
MDTSLPLWPESEPTVEQALWAAQQKAEALFAEIVTSGLIRPGVLESELTAEIHALAKERFGVRRHWHKRVVRAGPNTLLSYYANPPERRLGADDVVYVDLGPVFNSWEADFGRTYALGQDPLKHKLVADIEAAFRKGKQLYLDTPDLTTGELYDYVQGLAKPAGWEFGAATAGHLIGHFPHEHQPGVPRKLSIRPGNTHRLREPDSKGAPRHWILEIFFIDKVREYGGFFEELLTVGPA